MPSATLLNYFCLCFSAFLAGIVNALAGGGTLLTFPTLMSVLGGGSTAGVLANGTSTTALVPASLGSAWAFRRELYHLRRFLVWLVPPSIVGAVIGTLLVTRLPPEYFDRLVPWLILTAATLFTIQPYLTRHKPQLVADDEDGHEVCDSDTPIPRHRLAGMIALQFFIAIYGGYFGAGIGILMLSGLGLMGLSNIHQMNGLKAVLGTAINSMSVVIFVTEGKIIWPYALAMMATSVVGGYIAAHYSRQVPGKYVRWLVIIIGFCLAAFYFWRQLS